MAEVPIRNSREIVGFAHIAIPGKVDRDEFVAYCHSMEQVFIITSEGEFIQDVFISRDLLNWVVFPEDDQKLGSQVVFVNNSEHNKPVIVAMLSRQSDRGFMGEGQFSFQRTIGENTVSLVGDAKGSSIGLSVVGKGSKISLRAIGEDSQISIISQGAVDIIAKGEITVKSLLKQVILNEGEFGGLIKVEELVAELKKTNGYLETLRSATKNALTLLDALVPTSAAFELEMLGQSVGDYSEIENKEVKH